MPSKANQAPGANRATVAVVGSLNYDLICVLDRLPALGETLTAREHATAFGGKGANQAVAAARLGARTAMIGAVGSDETGRAMARNLEDSGIDASGLLSAPGPSGVAMINIDANGDNTIVVYPGANARLTPGWVQGRADAIRGAGCLVLQLETPLETVLAAARVAGEAGVPVLLNPAPARPLPDEIWPLCAVVTPNETELALLSGVAGVEEGARVLLGKGVGAVVVTLGSRGCLLMDERGSLEVPSFKVDAVDATAAGDSFNGALATRLAARGLEHSEASAEARAGLGLDAEDLRFCNAAGALAATRLGAQPSIPRLDEVEAFLRRV